MISDVKNDTVMGISAIVNAALLQGIAVGVTKKSQFV